MYDITIRYACEFGKAGECKRPGKDLTTVQAKKLIGRGYAVPAVCEGPVLPPAVADKAKDGEDQDRILKPQKTAAKASKPSKTSKAPVKKGGNK